MAKPDFSLSLLPPHANADTHKRIMARLAKMSPAEVFQSAVDAGIYTQNGELTEPYRSPGAPRAVATKKK